MSDSIPESIATLYGSEFVLGQPIEVASRDTLPFHHVKNIGQGSSAIIEMVKHKSTSQLFALKTFRCYNSRQFDKVRHAFKNEVGIMERLSPHRHIVQVLGTYICGRELSMLLSPVANGGDLAAYLARVFDTKTTRQDEVVLNCAFGCLASGLAYIHKHTIRHKDIKPQNILIHDGRVVYTDFGISFNADQQDTTTVGYPGVYTPRYCAPEVQDWADRNRKTDVYSLGCVFVEILDVLEPEVGLRHTDTVPYFRKLDEVRRRLFQASAIVKWRTGLLRICHDMLEPDQANRIDTSNVLHQITVLGSPKNKSEIGLFCDDCMAITEFKDTATQEELVEDCSNIGECKDPAIEEELVDDSTVLPREPNSNVDISSSTAEIESTPKKRKKKKTVNSNYTMVTRYYCTTCGEPGHTSTKCPNECWACNELYHKQADCPNKCWTCDEVGHFARNCPNECDSCGKIGHPTDECPNECWTCGEVGHFASDCPDECFVCGELGHATLKCRGKCHKCGKVGHWRRDCGDACFECGELRHWAAQCPSKKKKRNARRGDACFECGKVGHFAADCDKKRSGWKPIFEQKPQGQFRLKSRRRY